MPYLIYSTPEEAVTRNDQAGADLGLAYHTHGKDQVTRFVWVRVTEPGDQPRAALVISNNVDLLTDSERTQLVETLPDDWQHPEDDNV